MSGEPTSASSRVQWDALDRARAEAQKRFLQVAETRQKARGVTPVV
jgi:hypothetical protein